MHLRYESKKKNVHNGGKIDDVKCFNAYFEKIVTFELNTIFSFCFLFLKDIRKDYYERNQNS